MSERRKSIKTYREIVEEKYVVFLQCSGTSENSVWSIGDRQLWAAMPASLSGGKGRMLMEQRKWGWFPELMWWFLLCCLPCRERRERELHEAYKNAKTQEEAESILQQYTERFTISEAVLERLQMPKILERSHSVEPNSPLKDPNPLRYLRQQSLPAPKFTATIEATIVPTTELEPSSSTGRTSPSKSVSKAVPMLTPKPYSQPKNTQEVLKNFKVGYITFPKGNQEAKRSWLSHLNI